VSTELAAFFSVPKCDPSSRSILVLTLLLAFFASAFIYASTDRFAFGFDLAAIAASETMHFASRAPVNAIVRRYQRQPAFYTAPLTLCARRYHLEREPPQGLGSL
jgi:hypothetical protein